jgi:hypothetical protein
MLAIDKRKGRGVVVLSYSTLPIADIGWRLLDENRPFKSE